MRTALSIKDEITALIPFIVADFHSFVSKSGITFEYEFMGYDKTKRTTRSQRIELFRYHGEIGLNAFESYINRYFIDATVTILPGLEDHRNFVDFCIETEQFVNNSLYQKRRYNWKVVTLATTFALLALVLYFLLHIRQYQK